ncbi:770_t:CDS:2, partial [Funneliformis geosporum]
MSFSSDAASVMLALACNSAQKHVAFLIPEELTGRLQPLDVGINKIFKSK